MWKNQDCNFTVFKLDINPRIGANLSDVTTNDGEEFSTYNRRAYRVPYRIESHKMNLIGFVQWEFPYKIRSYIRAGKKEVVVRARANDIARISIYNSADIIITDFVRNFTRRVNYAVEIAWHLLFWRCRFDVKQTHVTIGSCVMSDTSRASIYALLINLIRVNRTLPCENQGHDDRSHEIFN